MAGPTIHLSVATFDLAAELDIGHVRQADRLSFAHQHQGIAQILQGLHPSVGAQEIFLFHRWVNESTWSCNVGGAYRTPDIIYRNREFTHADRIHHHLVLLNPAADSHQGGDPRLCQQAVTEIPIHQRA